MTRFAGLRRCYARSEGGSVSILMSLSLLSLLLAAGAAVDYGQAIRAKAQLQVAADIAALAGSTDSDRPDERRLENVKLAFAANFDAPVLDPATVITLNGRRTRVEASATVPTSLLKLMGISDIEVGVIAEATATDEPVCIVSLEKSDKEAIYLNSDSKIIAPDCIARVNSNHSDSALFGNSGPEMVTKSTCVVGGYRSNSGATFDPAPETGCAVFDDPLAWLPAPLEADLACTYNDVVVQNGQVRTFAPGVYCNKLEINS
ncbi:MAG TPA: pilus assembly protein TadG-related protein, partial [Sphingomicrobium sp.]|nr:pilus assembly protein TadG-related protein [Sphingomicrobium sp.]